MGVTGLWTVVQPCARPIKIETLNKKRLAVDASIWIYQFLKAVRDKEGNALRNSHVVGFFRRICKLLFVGILPVFVFDGGAPALKRQTISARRSRREGRKEDAVRTAGKLLALQMQRAAEEEDEKRKQAQSRPAVEEEVLPENLVYVDELQMTQQERQQNRKFKKKDQYHLPDLDATMAEMGGPNDPRIMSLEELETYARQFESGEDIDVYDFSKIDFDSVFFTSLPASDRYNILNAARLRSRLRMGYSKEQLDTMFPDRMAFSKFQIERVTERNELTQRLMNINGMNDDSMFGINGSGRIAGEKGREYVLVKNDGVEGGWALGVVSNKDEGKESKPIDVDELSRRVKVEDEDDEAEDEEDFEDVPIEGLNRLPKANTMASDKYKQQITAKRQRVYNARRGRKSGARRPAARRPAPMRQEAADSLFVADDPEDQEELEGEEEGEEDDDQEDLFEDENAEATDDEELNRAIAMSMQQNGQDDDTEDLDGAVAMSPENDKDAEDDNGYLENFEQSRAEEGRPVPKASGKAIAHIFNQRAGKAAPKAAFVEESDSDEGGMDFQDALQESRNGKHQAKGLMAKQQRGGRSETPLQRPAPSKSEKPPQQKGQAPSKNGFGGALPFEKLDLGSSLLGKKKMEDIQQNTAGGFEKEQDKKKDDAQPLPPWFAGDLGKDMAAQRKIEQADWQKAKEYRDTENFEIDQSSVLRREDTREVIDVDAPEKSEKAPKIIELDDQELEPVVADEPDASEVGTMGTVADALRAAPAPVESPRATPEPVIAADFSKEVSTEPSEKPDLTTTRLSPRSKTAKSADRVTEQEDEHIDWSESDREEAAAEVQSAAVRSALEEETMAPEKSPSPDFEDVVIPSDGAETMTRKQLEARRAELLAEADKMSHITGTADQNAPVNDDAEAYGFYSDSEDEELMAQLGAEAEEHARFASQLNHKPQAQNVMEYEKELKQLRSQQKKDRRDADEVTQIMITECQQLLKLFGLPYITAPMEAEAQCAELVRLNLVDGIVTDDSDCFLFGGTRIYKNMFNQAKFVECYLSTDLEKEFDLTRQKLIGIAQLLGSDYTEGLPGVGPVSALEILSEFSSLTVFKEWWNKVQMNTIPRSEDAGNAFKRKFRKNVTKLFLPPSFPDPRVDLAYTDPEVDSDDSPFQWGVPDLDALRTFLMATIGWTAERTDEVLVPVIKDMNRRHEEGTQSNITKFFSGGLGAGGYAPRVRLEQGSRRMGSALDRMAKKAQNKRKGGAHARNEDVVDGPANGETGAEQTEQTKPRQARKRKARTAAQEDADGEDEEDAVTPQKKQKKAGRRKKRTTVEDDD